MRPRIYRMFLGLSVALAAGCSTEEPDLAPPAVAVEAQSAQTSDIDAKPVQRLFGTGESPAGHVKVGSEHRWPVHRFFDSGWQRVDTGEDHTFLLGDLVAATDLHAKAEGFIVQVQSPFGPGQHVEWFDAPVAQEALDTLRVSLLPFGGAGPREGMEDVEPQARVLEIVPAPWEFVSEPVRISGGARLEFSYATEIGAGTPAELRVYFETGSKRRLEWNTRTTGEHTNWRDVSLDLSRYDGRTGRFVVRADSVPTEGLESDWIAPVFGSPLLINGAVKPAATLPNVILISIDTLRADHLGCYGYRHPTSPNVDRFAEDAILFEQAFAPASWTLPSHAAIMSGLHPTQQPRSDQNYYRLPGSVDMIAEAAAAAGYLTAAVTDGALAGGDYGFAQGFDRYYDGPGHANAPDGSSADIFKRSLAWIEEHQDQPFFLFSHTYEVHGPYRPIEPYRSQFAPDAPGEIPAINRYDAEIAHTDHQVGRFLNRVTELGLNDKTIIIFISDHGEEFGEHGNTLHMKTVYRESLHVPLIIRMPNGQTGRIARLVSITDLYATLLDMMGVENMPRFESRSLMSFLDPGWHGDAYAREVVPSNLRNLRDGLIAVGSQAGPWKYIVHGSIAPKDAGSPPDARLDRLEFHLLEELAEAGSQVYQKPEEMLFDVESDPYEQHDLSGEHPEQLVIERRRVHDYLQGLDGERPFIEPETDPAPMTQSEREDLEALGYL